MHAVAPWDVHSCSASTIARARGATCDLRARRAVPVGAESRRTTDQTPPCPGPGRCLGPQTPYVYVLSHPLASPPRWTPRILFRPRRSAKPRYAHRAARHDTIPPYVITSRYPFAFLSLVRYPPDVVHCLESADPACLACGGIAPKRTLWPLWTAGRWAHSYSHVTPSLDRIIGHAYTREYRYVTGTDFSKREVTQSWPISDVQAGLGGGCNTHQHSERGYSTD